MVRTLRIGNAHGFWGDRLDAAAEMVASEPDLDYLTLDFLAEVSMSILARQKQRDPEAGFARDVLDIIRSLAPYWRAGGRCRLITNAGGLDPLACGRACITSLQEAGCTRLRVAVVSGDDVLEAIHRDHAGGQHTDLLRNLDTQQDMADVIDRLVSAHAYLGARPIADALDRGADLVVTGRVADPSLTVGACVHQFGWQWQDWQRLAGATVAGHLIECGTQVTGGIATDWLDVPDVARMGFPIVELNERGECVVTKPRGSGGCVTEAVVKEQLLYEIGDPANYLSPDVTVSFLPIEVQQQAPDRVHVRGATGRAPPETLKVSATWQSGFSAVGQLTVFGIDAASKARRAADVVLEQLRRSGAALGDVDVQLVGAGACVPPGCDREPVGSCGEVGLRIAAASPSREAMDHFVRAMTPLITSGPPGTTGYAEGRPRVHPQFAFWPCLIKNDRLRPEVQVLCSAAGDSQRPHDARRRHTPGPGYEEPVEAPARDSVELPRAPRASAPTGRLIDIAHARSGDKGQHANIGVIARDPQAYQRLRHEVTVERVALHLGVTDAGRVRRFELPNLGALNFVIAGILENPLRHDAQGKALGQFLLQMPIGPPGQRGEIS